MDVGKFYMTQGMFQKSGRKDDDPWDLPALESKQLSNLLLSVAPAEFEQVLAMPG